MDLNEKHLEFIQNVISRHNGNSFMIKSWSITICTGVFALSGALHQANIALFAVFPVIIFWLLDSFYLANERCFVSLYNAVINGNKLDVSNKFLKKQYQSTTTLQDGRSTIDPEVVVTISTKTYSMDYSGFNVITRNSWFHVAKSFTILWFYTMLVVFSIGVFIVLSILGPPVGNEQMNALKQSNSILVSPNCCNNEEPNCSGLDQSNSKKSDAKGDK